MIAVPFTPADAPVAAIVQQAADRSPLRTPNREVIVISGACPQHPDLVGCANFGAVWLSPEWTGRPLVLLALHEVGHVFDLQDRPTHRYRWRFKEVMHLRGRWWQTTISEKWATAYSWCSVPRSWQPMSIYQGYFGYQLPDDLLSRVCRRMPR